MKKFLARLFNAPWYSIVFGAYPILALLSENKGQVEPSAIVRPLLLSLLFSAVILLIAWLVFRKIHKAAFFSVLFLLLFFTYGHVYMYFQEKFPENTAVQWLWVVWTILLVLAIVWVTRPKLSFETAASSLNGMILVLLIMSITQLDFNTSSGNSHRLGARNAPIQEDLVLPENPPDVYFFLLDSYGRSDLLQSAYGYDNSDFENALKERGFYIANESQSNYVRTEISLGSSLNMQYLQELDPAFNPQSIGRKVLWDALKHNAVRYNFDTLGYETINFASGFAWLEISDSDQFISPPPISSGMTEFEGLFLRTTWARYAEKWGWIDSDAIMADGYRDRFNTIFTSMDSISKMPEPKFVYAHVISPHPPFVFDPEGNPTNPADFWNEKRQYTGEMYKKGYLNQLPYLNTHMLEAIDTIMANSKTPPIIIIQGDHGPWLQPKDKRMWNFTAVYMPGHEDTLYPTITPVNLFRLVFNNYFGGKYDILKDVSYFSPVPKLYEFTEIPNPYDEGH
ncbi:MAG: hypothetical protein U0V18_14195 [Anaerolineales bacterium]